MKIIVTIDNRRFEVEVGDLSTQPVRALVDGKTFDVWTQDSGTPAAVTSPAVPAPSNGTEQATVNAPIPGVIVSIAVAPGDRVTPGQVLCTLEAMKMKNLIRASREGQIAAVRVTAGQHVQRQQVLMEYA